MEKIISFSLYGNDAKYCIGALNNVKLQPVIYPGWKCRIYYNNTVPLHYIEQLKEAGAQLIDMSSSPLNNYGMYWRFLVYDDKNVERFIVRDTDSRLSAREKHAVDEWISSGKTLHIMRDHPYHNVKILGGTWGIKNDFKLNMYDLIQHHLKDSAAFKYNDDQLFLNSIYDYYINDMIAHDDFFNYPFNKPFPTKRAGLEFIGEVFNEKNIAVAEHAEILNKYLHKNKSLFKRIRNFGTTLFKSGGEN